MGIRVSVTPVEPISIELNVSGGRTTVLSIIEWDQGPFIVAYTNDGDAVAISLTRIGNGEKVFGMAMGIPFEGHIEIVDESTQTPTSDEVGTGTRDNDRSRTGYKLPGV